MDANWFWTKAVSVITLALMLTAAGLCVAHRDLSPRMKWMIGGLSTFVAVSLGHLGLYQLAVSGDGVLSPAWPLVTGVLIAASIAGWGLFVFGLGAVLRDVRARLARRPEA